MKAVLWSTCSRLKSRQPFRNACRTRPASVTLSSSSRMRISFFKFQAAEASCDKGCRGRPAKAIDPIHRRRFVDAEPECFDLLERRHKFLKADRLHDVGVRAEVVALRQVGLF